MKIWAEDIVLTWQPSTGQQGYRVYADNQLVTPAPADATSANIELTYAQVGGPVSHILAVEAFNGSSTSPQAMVTVPGCP